MNAMNKAIEYKIVTGSDAQEVVRRMICTSRTGSEARRAIDVFSRFIDQNHIDASRQPVALLNGQIIGYAMILVNPGAIAGVFLPQQLPELWGHEGLTYEGILIELLKLLADQMDSWDLAIIQTILGREDESSSKQIFREGGFFPLCDLTIMESKVTADRSVCINEDVEWVAFEEAISGRFEQVILESYKDSKDCPLLTGLRTGSEVLEGHRWSGNFLPKGWWIIRHQGRDAGVILLNGSQEDPDRLELIYMGLTHWARGRNLGRTLLAKGFDVAASLGKKIIRLAVDQKNVPARRLYDEMGFIGINQQVVLAVLNEKRRERLRGINT
jgi:GNAT superfamily N-acetyltransferase